MGSSEHEKKRQADKVPIFGHKYNVNGSLVNGATRVPCAVERALYVDQTRLWVEAIEIIGAVTKTVQCFLFAGRADTVNGPATIGLPPGKKLVALFVPFTPSASRRAPVLLLGEVGVAARRYGEAQHR